MLKLIAPLKDYIWGGSILTEEYGKSSGGPVAESWELSAHPDGKSRVSGGEFDGTELTEVLKTHPEYCSTGSSSFETLPVLFKLIDSAAPLSIQVHPDDAYALRTENCPGKSECWYILGASEGAHIYLGLNKNTPRGELEERIRDGSLESVLNRIPVRPGEIYYIPAGTLHAIGAGVTLAELQQSSNITYRVYDYNRPGKDGKPRELHVRKALDVIRPEKGIPAVPSDRMSVEENGLSVCNIMKADMFYLDRLELSGEAVLPRLNVFCALTCIGGQASLSSAKNSVSLKKGETVFVCAGEEIRLSGNAIILRYGSSRG